MKRVADPGADRRAAVLADDLGHGLRADQVVQDRRAGLLVEHRRRRPWPWWCEPESRSPCSSTRNTRSASPSKARPTSAPISSTRACRSPLVLGLDRVGGVVRERAVELAVEDLEVERQPSNTAGHDEAAHAVGGVGHDLQRLQHRQVDERADVVGERRRAGRCVVTVPGRSAAAGTPAAASSPDLGEAGVLADRPGAGEAELDAVVLRPGCARR